MFSLVVKLSWLCLNHESFACRNLQWKFSHQLQLKVRPHTFSFHHSEVSLTNALKLSRAGRFCITIEFLPDFKQPTRT